jgi:hypothetical protein
LNKVFVIFMVTFCVLITTSAILNVTRADPGVTVNVHTPVYVGDPVIIEFSTDPGEDGTGSVGYLGPAISNAQYIQENIDVIGGQPYTVTAPGITSVPGTYHIYIQVWGADLPNSLITGSTSFEVLPSDVIVDLPDQPLLEPSIDVEISPIQYRVGDIVLIEVFVSNIVDSTDVDIMIDEPDGILNSIIPGIFTSGSTTLTVNTPGTYTVTATIYVGGIPYSDSTQFTVSTDDGQQPPSDGGIDSIFDFTISLAPSTQTVKQGNTAQFQIQLTYSDPSWAGTPVNYQIIGLSSGITWTPINGGLFSLSTSSITPPGTYTFTVIGSAQGITRQTTGTLIVTTESTTSQTTSTTQTTTSQTQVTGDFSILPSPVERTINQGQTATYSLTIDKSGEFNDPVTLTSVTGEPPGSTPELTIKDGTPKFTSTLTIKVADSTPPGTYTITVEASGGGRIHTTSLTLIVNENTQLSSASTTTSNTQESKTSESNSLDFLSDTTNLLLLITIIILAIALITILVRRSRSSSRVPARTYTPTRYCQECGKPSKTTDPFCSSCGKRLN